jgi:hypothetical protein
MSSARAIFPSLFTEIRVRACVALTAPFPRKEIHLRVTCASATTSNSATVQLPEFNDMFSDPPRPHFSKNSASCFVRMMERLSRRI